MKTTMWRAGLVGALSLLSIAPLAHADEEEGAWGPLTGGVTLTSDYRFRGLSQTDRDAAIQGWLQVDFHGFFFNVWASNIDFNDAAIALTTDDSSVEIDLTAGYTHAFSDTTSGTIKGVYYWYPDADYIVPGLDYDYFEAIVGLSHDFGMAAVSAEVAWSPDYFGKTGDAVAVKGGVVVPIVDQLGFMGALSASANVGYQWIENNFITDDPVFFYDAPDYLYFDFGASAEWEIFVFDVRWVDTDLDDAECFPGNPANVDFCEGGVVVSVTANLPG